MTMQDLFLVLGGLGLFLFGMKIMSNGLKQAAGDRLQTILQKATANRFLAVFAGIAATVALNSSTASTIITVSLVNSSLLTLTQAIGIKLGANVGTTFSAQLVAFRVDAYALPIIFVGILLYMFVKKRGIKNLGYLLLGFGLLFYGISVMSSPLRALAENDYFVSILTTFENPFLALLAGFVFTAVVNSSTATSGILVALLLNDVPIPFQTSAFILLGVNLGTSITTIIASIPANRAAKRSALFHITFDVIGSLIFGPLIFFFPQILGWFTTTFSEPARQVAMFHTIYNIATMLLILPFVSQVAKIMEKIIPLKSEEAAKTFEKKLIYLDTKTMLTPAIAVMNAHLEVCRMGKMANKNLKIALESFYEKDVAKAESALENEKTVDYLNSEIAKKLVFINRMKLTKPQAKKIGKMFQVLLDIERIGDHAENIAEYTIAAKEEKIKFSEAARQELKTLGNLTAKLTENALEIYESGAKESFDAITSNEDEIDKFAAESIEKHIERVKTGNCDPKSGIIFTDMIIDLERSADHANNIAFLT